VPFQLGPARSPLRLMGGHIDAGVMNPNEIVAQIEAQKARNLAVAARSGWADAPDVRRSREGLRVLPGSNARVVGPAWARAVKWWQDTLRKVRTPGVERGLHSSATSSRPTQWDGPRRRTSTWTSPSKYAKARTT